MDETFLASLTRLWTGAVSRRDLLCGLANFAFVTGSVRCVDTAEAKRKHKRRNKAKKHCGPCKKRKNGKPGTCNPKPNGTPCGDGGTCQGGKCQEPPPDPTCAETCDGCCSGTACAPGDADDACGQGGDTCEDCAHGCRCCGGACCDGCCFDGQCYPGTHSELCGSGGVACAECPIEEICTVDRVCAPPTCGNGGPCLVFVTSWAVNGNLGGLDGADEICQFLAEENGLPGTYLAWLSDDIGAPSARFMRSPGPYLLLNETIIADDWADLTSGSLKAPINRTEEDEPFLPPFETWTNTKVDGTLDESLADCESWATVNAVGSVGNVLASTANWTDENPFQTCSISAHIYCFQQS
jgi:hypothetical protein